MSNGGTVNDIDFTVDRDNLYREIAITDIKVASIRHMIPIKADGTDDPDREAIFVGHTQLMSPEGPVPIQAKLSSDNLEDAIKEFPGAMRDALVEIIGQLQEMQRQKQDDSRIIVPGADL